MVGSLPDERGFHLRPWGVPLTASFQLLEMSPGALEPSWPQGHESSQTAPGASHLTSYKVSSWDSGWPEDPLRKPEEG